MEIVRRIYAEWERGNFAAAAEWYEPEIRFEAWMPGASENVTVHGLAELRDFMGNVELFLNYDRHKALEAAGLSE